MREKNIAKSVTLSTQIIQKKKFEYKKIKTTSEKKMKFSSKNVSHPVFYSLSKLFFTGSEKKIYFFNRFAIAMCHTQTHKTFESFFFGEFSQQ